MTHSNPIEDVAILRIGTVHYVAPDQIDVSLDIEAPSSVSLNAGHPRPFPRVNGYVLVSADGGYLVGQIEWIAIENAAYPKRKGVSDSGLIDLPYPARKMKIAPLGMLHLQARGKQENDESKFKFQRGVKIFPSVGSEVLLPKEEQLQAIIENEHRRVKIGTSPLLGDADVYVDPDCLFGRHLAVLGNTGSGKSCTVAGLVRWCLQEAMANAGKSPNARFVILDANGEYKRAFQNMKGTTSQKVNVKVFSAVTSYSKENTNGLKSEPLRVPMWFWNSSEWVAFTEASPKTQRPALIEALRVVKSRGVGFKTTPAEEMHYVLDLALSKIGGSISKKEYVSDDNPDRYNFKGIVEWCHESISNADSDFPREQTEKIKKLQNCLQGTLKKMGKYANRVPYKEVKELLESVREAYSAFSSGGHDALPNEDKPLPFRGKDFAHAVETVAEKQGNSKHVDTLVTRIRSMLSNQILNSIVGDENLNNVKGDNGTTMNYEQILGGWLNDYVGKGRECNEEIPSISIIDLSLIPSEVEHIIVSVIVRMIFEALQRYRQQNKDKIFPVVLVMEEAHNFIKRYKDDAEYQTASIVCCKIFEKIAREGRKFGLGMVVSSQRPSELSPTVLSQCNSFLVHRISNDRDQETVSRLVPDNLRGLFRELPSLPSQHAILLGWASELPLLVNINNLNESERPTSDDPSLWKFWTRRGEDQAANWESIAKKWQE